MPRYVDKFRIPAEVALRGQPPLRGFLSVMRVAEFHDGPETVLDLLNASVRVVPFMVEEDESVVLLTRFHIDWVRVADPGFARFVRPAGYHITREEPVEITLTDGTRIEGTIQMELPPELNRATDFLNGEGDFYPLVTESGPVIVNKARVVKTRLYQASPPPIPLFGEL